MKRSSLLIALGSLALAACGPAEVVVTAELETIDPTTGETVIRPISDLELSILPYDRDLIFDSLEAAFATPEPPIPPELVTARDSIRVAQQRWRNMQDRWNVLRDSMQTINEQLGQYARGEPRYVQLFNAFSDVEAEYNRLDRQQQAAFERFDSLQQASLAQTQEIRVLRENWAAEAFAEIDAVMANAITASGLDAAVDTTDASGIASFQVKPGEYWVHGRLEEVFTELYWNLPITVTKGEPNTVTLTRQNAEVRPNL